MQFSLGWITSPPKQPKADSVRTSVAEAAVLVTGIHSDGFLYHARPPPRSALEFTENILSPDDRKGAKG